MALEQFDRDVVRLHRVPEESPGAYARADRELATCRNALRELADERLP